MHEALASLDVAALLRKVPVGGWIVLGLAVMTMIERARPARDYRDYWWRGFGEDVAAFAVITACSFLVDPTQRFIVRELSFLRVGIVGDSIALQAIGALLLGDFLQYWIHRGMHSYTWFGNLMWNTHRWHHEPTALTAIAGYRGSILHRLLFGLALVIIPAIVFDIRSPTVIAIILTYNTIHELVLHSNTKIHFGPLSWLFATPAWHRVHHARDGKLQGTNLGNRITIWDRLFGTYSPVEALAPDAPLGIDEPKRRSRLAVIIGT
jgi:sterol desaturase/sphingolipid hydroxylase (fatty acid hydroxylase superfamily)